MTDLVANPFADGAVQRPPKPSSTAMAISNRDVAEVQTRYLMAKRFPRDLIAVADNVINAFSRKDLAEQAEYEYSRGGEKISGPTIRTAEAIAQQFGNIDFGFKEASRGTSDDGVNYSDVETWAVDLQSGARRSLTFIVRHWRDKKNGAGYKVTDERDISELIGNQAQRRVRGCILAVIPGDITELAMKQVEVTLKASADTSPEAIAQMVKKFGEYDVTPQMIEKRIQRRLDAVQPAQVISLRRVFNSLKDGMSVAADWFEPSDAAAAPPPSTTVGEMATKGRSAGKGKPASSPPPAPAASEKTTATDGEQQDGAAPFKVEAQGSVTNPTPITGEEVDPPAGAVPAGVVVKDDPLAPRGDVVAGPTYAEVRGPLEKATTVDQLDDAAALIQAVGNRSQAKELNELYAKRRAELGGD